MKRKVMVPLLALSGLLLSSAAGAQVLGNKGDAIFGAERLFGVRGEHWVEDYPGPSRTEVTNLVLGFGFAEQRLPYDIPRLAFDYLVVDHLSLGGALGFSLSNVTTSDNLTNVPPTTFLIAPRVGYLHMFGKVAGIWPRGGFTYHHSSVEDQYKESGFAIDLECMFPIVVAGHFGFEIGFTFDQSLTANRDPDNGVSYPLSYRSIALQVGLFGWL